jgi:hypothetical protein
VIPARRDRIIRPELWGAAFLVLGLLLKCTGPEDDLPNLTLDDIKEQYRIVDSLNTLIFSNELETSGIDRYVVLGRDIRNEGIVVRRGEERFLGCIKLPLIFGLFYESGDSNQCSQIEGTKIIDYEGYAGIPRYVGCAPDTSL